MAQGVVSDPIDKLVTFVIVWAVLLALPDRFKAQFGGTPARATRRSAARKLGLVPPQGNLPMEEGEHPCQLHQ